MRVRLWCFCLSVVYSFIAFFSLLTAAQPFTLINDEAKVSVLTPSFADRKTAKIRLSNGLEAYLISDPRAEKSAAAMVVKVGSWEDPDDAGGMAHFVEHASFLGTKTYPEESDFDRFITQHGGTTNASTAVDNTQYVFSVNTDAFPQALDRFARFFYEPLFNSSGLDREINAIDQEFARIARDDDGRLALVLQSLGNPKHPNTRFTIGNKTSLSSIKREDLIKWHDEHYSANLMSLIVYSSLGIDKLEELVSADFVAIPNLKRSPYVANVFLGDPSQKPTVTHVESLKDSRILMLYWELPGRFARMLDSRPHDVICYVLGDEGDGSLLAALKKEGLADGLVCAGLNYGSNNFRVYIEVKLTKKGLRDVDQVTDRIFQAIDELKSRSDISYLFRDVQQIALNRYQYQERQDAYEVVSQYAEAMVDEEMPTFPEKSYLLKKYDPKAIADLLAALTPQTVQMAILAPANSNEIKLNRLEKWAGTPFAISSVPTETIERWKNLEQYAALDIPKPNSYLPKNLKAPENIQKNPKAFPNTAVLIDDAFGKLYFARDEYYLVPQVCCTFAVLTPQIDDGDVRKAVLADLFVKAVQETLNRSLYPAQVAGLDFQVSVKTYYLMLQLYGYSEHASRLLQSVVEGLKNIRPSEADFVRFKESVSQDYRNFSAEAPLTQASELMSSVLSKAFSTDREKARVITRINHGDFLDYCGGLFALNYVKGILYGDLDEKEAKAMVAILRDGLGGKAYPIKDHKKKEIADLSTLSNPHYLVDKIKIPGSAIILAIETAPYSFKNQAVQGILTQGLSAPFFDTLRTQQQTGYAVGNWDQEMERRLFIFLGVESDSYDVRDILARYELFLEDFYRQLGVTEIGDSAFTNIRQALANKLEKPAQNVKDMGVILGTLAIDYNGEFDWLDRRIAAMQALSYPDFLTTARQMLSSQNKKRIAVMVKGSSPDGKLLEYVPSRNAKELRGELDYEPADHVIGQQKSLEANRVKK